MFALRFQETPPDVCTRRFHSLDHLDGATIYGVVEAGSSGPVPETQVRLVFHQRVYHLQVLVTLQGQELETPDVMVKSLYFLQI